MRASVFKTPAMVPSEAEPRAASIFMLTMALLMASLSEKPATESDKSMLVALPETQVLSDT